MPKKYKCPVEGCTFVGDSKYAVQAHIISQKDPAHKALRGPGLWEKIVEIEVEEGGEIMGGSQPQVEEVEEVQEDEETKVEQEQEQVEEVTDNELLELANRIEEVTVTTKLKELESKITEFERTIAELKQTISSIERRLGVHKQSILKILKALGVQ